jgi:hypothetical protein
MLKNKIKLNIRLAFNQINKEINQGQLESCIIFSGNG